MKRASHHYANIEGSALVIMAVAASESKWPWFVAAAVIYVIMVVRGNEARAREGVVKP